MAKLNNQFEKERSLFLRALEFTHAEERKRFLEQQCANDAFLYNQIRELLSKHDTESSLLDAPIFGEPQDSNLTSVTRSDIEGYEFEAKLGEGGMGEVWSAIQHEPVSRRVAIKLIKPGIHTPNILRRFKTEREALAAMDHPNIAKILNAGLTKNELPYFVMELIDGCPLIQFCDDQRLSIDERLRLFVSIANAVQHAHQRAVIHRDLKPSNILVTLIDGHPSPKIIDFGLAKALGDGLNKDSIQTQVGTVIGTLAYMAPEQASLNRQDVDTRTDVYSLGVMLYELLTGLKPLDSNRFAGSDIESTFQMIRDDEPTPPSARLSTYESALQLAESRRSNPVRLAQTLRGELDWIVLKALEKDRARRYQSAGEFAEDLVRFINDEPIIAHPPSSLYRAKKFLVRNRVFVSAVLAVSLAMVCGLIGTSYGLVKARLAETIADRERKAAETARDIANDEAAVAKTQSSYAQAIANFMQFELFPLTTVDGQLLEGLQPDDLGHDATLGQLLDRATKQLVQRDDIDLKAKSDLLRVLGVSYRLNEKHDEAIHLLRKACEIREQHFLDDARGLLSCFNSLVVALGENMQHEEAIEIANDAIEAVSDRIAKHDETLLNARQQLAEQYASSGNAAEARRIIDDVSKLALNIYGENSDQHLKSLVSAGLIYSYTDQKDLALDTLANAVGRTEDQLGSEHPEYTRALNFYGNALFVANRIDDAAEAFRKLVRIENQKYGRASIASMQPMNNIGAVYWKKKQLDKSVPIFEDLVQLSESHFGRGHPKTLFQIANLAINYRDDKDYEKAEELFEEILEQEHRPEFVPAEFRKLLVASKNKSRFQTIAALEIDLGRAKFQANKIGLANLMVRIGNDARILDLPLYAIEIFREVLQIQEELQPNHWHTYATRQLLATTLVETEEYEEANSLLETVVEKFVEQRQQISSADQRIRSSMTTLIKVSKLMGDKEATERWTKRLNSMSK